MAWFYDKRHASNPLIPNYDSILANDNYLADPAGRQQRFYANFLPPLHHGDAPVLRVQLWLQTCPPGLITIDRMAVEAKLGQRTFMRRFQKATGLTPTEYVQHLKVQKARELLEFTTLSIKEISWKVDIKTSDFFEKPSKGLSA